MSEQLTQLLLIALFVTIGFMVGALITLWWYERAKNREKAARELAEKQEEEGENTRQQKYREVVRLWRDRRTNKLLVETGGKIHAQLGTLSDEQRQALEMTIREWAVWLGLGKPSQPPAVAQRAQQPAAAQPAAPTRQAPAPAIPMPAAAIPAAEVVLEPAPTMVAQINEIVQAKLPGSGLKDYTIRLVESQRDGVGVWVNGTRYLGVDEVAEPQVQALLKEAVAEWEQRAR